MMGLLRRSAIAAAVVAFAHGGSAMGEQPKYGGILDYVVPADPPSYDRAGPEKLDSGLRCVPPFIGGTRYG